MNQSETVFQIGDDLYGISVAELKSRVGVLKAEIERIETELAKKETELSAADLLFKPRS